MIDDATAVDGTFFARAIGVEQRDPDTEGREFACKFKLMTVAPR